MNRRSFLKQGLGVSAGLLATGLPRPARRALAAEARWRTFEVVTRVEPAEPAGVTRAWVPVPLMTETDYFRRLGDTWKGNASTMRLARDEKYDAGFVYGEWAATEKAPVLEVTSRYTARDVYGVRCADSAEFKSLGKSGDISKAQHCRAEVFLTGYGWVPVDPADVRKVVLEERPGGTIPLTDPAVLKARAKLFGAWEMNWLAYNYAHDLKLPSASGKAIPFLMYPQSENDEGRKDSLDPTTFRYTITAKEITG